MVIILKRKKKPAKNNSQKKKEYRLKKDSTVLSKLFSLFYTLDSLRLNKSKESEFVRLFENTDYYMRIPHFSTKILFAWSKKHMKYLLEQKEFYEKEIEKFDRMYGEKVGNLYKIEASGIKEFTEEDAKAYLVEPKRVKLKITKEELVRKRRQ